MVNQRSGSRTRPIPQFQFAVASGTVHGAVVTGESHDGAPVCSFDLLVLDPDTGRSLVPVTWRGAPVAELDDGAVVVARGRIEKRFHRAGGRTVPRTSLEATELHVAPRPAVIARLVARAAEGAGRH